MEKDIILLWYLMLSIDAETKVKMLIKYNSEENIYNNLDEILLNQNISIKIRNKFKEYNLNDAKELLIKLKEKSIGFITFNNLMYPDEFRQLSIPPYGFYYKGNINLLTRRRGSIVGSRKPSFYGLDMCSRISTYMAKLDIVIVSGLAQGIDSIAHKAALDAGGGSIGILGCGIEVVYPSGNRLLYNRMAYEGLIISEFQPFDKPLKFHFPMRNRLISALGEALVVVEASLRSGSLITANESLNLGKDIIAVPGRVGESNFEGCNQLIKDGACMFISTEDIDLTFKIDRKVVDRRKNDTEKDSILEVLNNETIHLDDIVERVNIDRESIFRLLFEMQNTKEIICLPGNFYAKLR